MEFIKTFQLFKIKEYKYFIISRIIFVLGLRMLSTCVLYQVYQLTKSTYAVGMAGLAEFLPVTITAIFAGSFTDRNNKRTILLSAYFGFFIAGLCLFFAQNFSNATLLLSLYIIIFFTGIFRSFASPASSGMLAAMVPTQSIPQAAGFSSQAWMISSIAGHASAGFIIAGLGQQWAFGIITILFFTSVLLALPILPKPPKKSATSISVSQSIKEGFQFVWQTKSLLGVMSLDLFAVFFGGIVAFIPEICEKVLFAGPKAFGWMNAAIDIGGLVSIILLTFSPLRKQQGLKMLIAVAVFGICIIAFAFSTNYYLSFVLLLVAGIADGISVVVRGVVMQTQTPDNLRGRVSSISSIFINSSNELGQFESGLTSRLFGTKNAIIFGGCATLLTVAFIGKFFPKLKQLKY
jgi:MFS family permease